MKETAYLVQAALVSAWWAGLVCSESFFTAFQFAGIPPVAFWSFFAPDILLIAGLSIARAYREIVPIEYVVLGAFGYASLYCFNATLLTSSGYLPTTLMLLGLCYNAFLCFNTSLFRSSQSGSIKNMIKTLMQIVCIWVLALVVIPFIILDAFGLPVELAGGVWFGLGLFLLVGFSGIGLASAWFMVRHGQGTPLPLDQASQLVVSGPYRWVRNPMAIAGVGQGLAVAILFLSIPVLVYSLLGAVLWHVVVRPIEERDLAKRFGDSYKNYRDHVPCWLPSLSRRAK